jgi:hypothetical protein
MNPRIVTLCGIGLLTLGLARAQEPAPLPELPPAIVPSVVLPGDESSRVLSESGQFRVQGGEQSQRSSLALLLEESARMLTSLLGEKDGVRSVDPKHPTSKPATPAPAMIPIDVILEGKPGDPPKANRISYDLRYTDTGFLLAMRLDLSRGIDNAELEHASVTLLLYERSLRGVKPADMEDRLVVKPWLVEGLGEADKWAQNGHGDWQLYEGVMKAGGGFTMDELFEMSDDQWKTLDPSSRLAFRVLSGATVMSLLSQPKGEEAFRSFLGEAARNSGETPVLMRKYFPDLNLSEKSLAKWVQLKLLEIARPDMTEPMSVTATESSLDDALKLHFRDKDGNAIVKGLDAWKEVAALKAPERVDAVRVAQEALVRMSYRCFPSYRATLEEYQQILRDLSKGDTKKIEQRLLELSDERQTRKKRAQRASDYMDYFEISRARDLSGQFDDYMKLKQALDENPRAPRTDRMSHAMDIIETTYGPKTKPKH